MASPRLLMKSNLLLLLVIITCSTIITTSSRPIIPASNTSSNEVEVQSMLQRLKLDEEDETGANCWAAMMELQSCTGEVIQFFYQGETYLGPACCRAIRVIQHHCWPNMLSTLGFSSQEGDILQGYCDSHQDSQHGNTNIQAYVLEDVCSVLVVDSISGLVRSTTN